MKSKSYITLLEKKNKKLPSDFQYYKKIKNF